MFKLSKLCNATSSSSLLFMPTDEHKDDEEDEADGDGDEEDEVGRHGPGSRGGNHRSILCGFWDYLEALPGTTRSLAMGFLPVCRISVNGCRLQVGAGILMFGHLSHKLQLEKTASLTLKYKGKLCKLLVFYRQTLNFKSTRAKGKMVRNALKWFKLFQKRSKEVQDAIKWFTIVFTNWYKKI